jgi:Tol biopolymer transport system component
MKHKKMLIISLITVIQLILSSSCKNNSIPVFPPSTKDSAFRAHTVPLWSADGKKIYFFGGFALGEKFGMYEMTLPDGVSKLLMQDSLEKLSPVISPDRSKIAYLANIPPLLFCCAHVYVVNIDGTNKKDLTPWGGNWSQLRWSPDGNKVIFEGAVEQFGEIHDQIFIVDVNTGAAKQLTHSYGNYENRDASYLYDGKRIAYFSGEPPYGNSGKVFITDEEGIIRTPIDTINAKSAYPRPSPTRNEMLFLFDNFIFGTYYINFDSVQIPLGTDTLYRYYNNVGVVSTISWSNNGDKIAFLFPTSSISYGLAVMGRDGTNYTVIEDDVRWNVVMYFHWSPDDKFISYKMFPTVPDLQPGNYIYDTETNLSTKINIRYK